jgi:hypothetical protein
MDRHVHRSLIQDEEKEECYQEKKGVRGYEQDESKGAPKTKLGFQIGDFLWSTGVML